MRGRFWVRVSIGVAIACGLVGQWIARATGALPRGWGWSFAAYVTFAVIGFSALVVILTKSGR